MLANVDSKKGIYIGTGAGLLLFMLLGLFPGAVVGGYIGLKLVELIVGPGSLGVVARILSAISMIVAVLVAAVVFIFGGALIGYAISRRLKA